MMRSHAIATLFVGLLLGIAPGTARAQADLGHLDDATVLPKGQFRFQAISAWTRYDSRFAPAGSGSPTIPLGSEYSFDSLGVSQLPAFSGTQSAIQALTGSPFHLSLGSTQAAADARVTVTPLRAEYGLTHRITLGIMLPLVRTRTSILLRVNPNGNEGNVGINPASVNAGALARDSAVVAQLVGAAATLQAESQSCQANANANANCGGILARQQDVNALLQSATGFATAFSAVYGANSQLKGAAVVPVAGSSADSLVRGRLTQLDSSFRAFLNTSSLITSAPAAAGAVVGTGDLATLLNDPGVAGFDSLKTTVRIGTGDVELSAAFLLFDGFTDTAATSAGALRGRATLTGTFRLPTGQLSSTTNPLDIATGRGTSAADARLATYIQRGSRVGISAAAEFVQPFGTTASGAFPSDYGAPFPPSTSNAYPYKPGAVLHLEIAPRIMVSRLLGLNALYDFRHVAANDYGALLVAPNGQVATPVATVDGVTSAPGTLQAAGFGITYSTVTEYERGKSALPLDVNFSHLEALHGADRMPKYFRDQIQIRLYYRRHR